MALATAHLYGSERAPSEKSCRLAADGIAGCFSRGAPAEADCAGGSPAVAGCCGLAGWYEWRM